MSDDALFIIFKEVATLPWPGIGEYRVRYFAGSELGKWDDRAAQSTVERMSNKAAFFRVTRDVWEVAKTGDMNGWASESDIDAPVRPVPCTEAGRRIAAERPRW